MIKVDNMIKLKRLAAVLLLVNSLLAGSVIANTEKFGQFDEHDVRMYDARKVGMNTLTLEVRIDGLTAEFNKQKIYGNLKDVYFVVICKNTEDVFVTVRGMPPGFDNVKRKLIENVKSQIGFFIYESMKNKFKAYSWKLDNSTLVGSDLTGILPVNEIKLNFNKLGLIEEEKEVASMMSSSTKFEYATKEWSNSKYVIEKIINEVKQQGLVIQTETSISYMKTSTFGLPREIFMKTSAKQMGQEKTSNNTEIKYIFSNVLINSPPKN